jgi:ubiquinone/menaquinone biosynthesis C-methylase UbiE
VTLRTPSGRGLSDAEAQRFYDAHGARLRWSEPFEGRAKGEAWARLRARPGDRVLEVGVGVGDFLSQALARVGAGGVVLGLDLSPEMLRLARARAPRALLVRGSAARLPVASATFDWVFTSYTLDLLPVEVIDGGLREMARVLRPGGRLIACGLTEGETPLERLFMGAWKRIQRLAPARVGGCRPLLLAGRVEAAGLEVLERAHVGQLGTPSEVIVAGKGS